MEKVIVSGCLYGYKCRYDGKDNYIEKIEELKKKAIVIPLCPEQMGGLSTPRFPSEIIGDKLMNNQEIDVTEEYMRGAKVTLELALDMGVQYALLKEKSPSCGKDKIYDGTFSGKLIEGSGVTAKLLQEHGIIVFSEDEIDELLESLK